MRKYLPLLALFFSCNQKKAEPVKKPFPSEVIPGDTGRFYIYSDTGGIGRTIDLDSLAKASAEPWLTQNIVTEKSCDIIFPPGCMIVKIGNRYTATYRMTEGEIWHKTALGDFSPGAEIQYYSDTCLLKSDLRRFISIKMTEVISYRTFNNSK